MKEHIRQSNLIEGIDDPAEDAQSMIAWEYLLDHNFPLTHQAICKVQKIITINQPLRPDQRGYYRDQSKVNVQVGSHIAPNYAYVRNLMDNWLLDYESLTPFEAHKRFEHIHPFVDGNGRTGRMLMWWQEIKTGKEPTLIKASERQKYYDSLGESL